MQRNWWWQWQGHQVRLLSVNNFHAAATANNINCFLSQPGDFLLTFPVICLQTNNFMSSWEFDFLWLHWFLQVKITESESFELKIKNNFFLILISHIPCCFLQLALYQILISKFCMTKVFLNESLPQNWGNDSLGLDWEYLM